MTWHQQQAMHRAYQAGTPLRLFHDTKWTLVDDPQGGLCCLTRFGTEQEAKDAQKRSGGYILRPTTCP